MACSSRAPTIAVPLGPWATLGAIPTASAIPVHKGEPTGQLLPPDVVRSHEEEGDVEPGQERRRPEPSQLQRRAGAVAATNRSYAGLTRCFEFCCDRRLASVAFAFVIVVAAVCTSLVAWDIHRVRCGPSKSIERAYTVSRSLFPVASDDGQFHSFLYTVTDAHGDTMLRLSAPLWWLMRADATDAGVRAGFPASFNLTRETVRRDVWRPLTDRDAWSWRFVLNASEGIIRRAPDGTAVTALAAGQPSRHYFSTWGSARFDSWRMANNGRFFYEPAAAHGGAADGDSASLTVGPESPFAAAIGASNPFFKHYAVCFERSAPKRFRSIEASLILIS